MHETDGLKDRADLKRLLDRYGLRSILLTLKDMADDAAERCKADKHYSIADAWNAMGSRLETVAERIYADMEARDIYARIDD